MYEGRIEFPACVQVQKRKYALNLNIYRNTHYYLLNQMKKNFSSLVQEQLKDIPKLKKVFLKYIVHPKTKRLFDVANVCSIADKFFCDALVRAGIIEDDNCTIVEYVSYTAGNKSNKGYSYITVDIIGETENEDQSHPE